MKLIAILLVALLAQEKSAEDQFKSALASAKESKKRVFLTFGSPG